MGKDKRREKAAQDYQALVMSEASTLVRAFCDAVNERKAKNVVGFSLVVTKLEGEPVDVLDYRLIASRKTVPLLSTVAIFKIAKDAETRECKVIYDDKEILLKRQPTPDDLKRKLERVASAMHNAKLTTSAFTY